jgi:ABC-type multidrug transport system fused ATPase/permease subunit
MFLHLTKCAVSGTLRSNLDPFGKHDDVRLWDALKRSYLVEDRKSTLPELSPDSSSTGARGAQATFTLDSAVDDEGGNLSVGQVRQEKRIWASVADYVSGSARWSLSHVLL